MKKTTKLIAMSLKSDNNLQTLWRILTNGGNKYFKVRQKHLYMHFISLFIIETSKCLNSFWVLLNAKYQTRGTVDMVHKIIPLSLSPHCMSPGVQRTRIVDTILKAEWCEYKYITLGSFLAACIHSFIYLLSNMVLGQIQTQFLVTLEVFTEDSSL